MVLIVKRVDAWLRKGWKTPNVALRWEQIYPLITLAVFVYVAVKLTPTVQQWGQDLIDSIGQSLQNIFNFTLG